MPQSLDYLLLIGCFTHGLQEGLTLSGDMEITACTIVVNQTPIRFSTSFTDARPLKHRPLHEPSLSFLLIQPDYSCLHNRYQLTKSDGGRGSGTSIKKPREGCWACFCNYLCVTCHFQTPSDNETQSDTWCHFKTHVLWRFSFFGIALAYFVPANQRFPCSTIEQKDLWRRISASIVQSLT